MYDWLEPNLQSLSSLTRDNTTFGITMKDKNYEMLLNTLIILGKFFIHKCKCFKTQPLFTVFKREFALYYKSL